MHIKLCPSPHLVELYASRAKTDLVVVVDVLRASATIAAALHAGAASVRCVATLSEAQQFLGQEGYCVAAERNAQKVNFADFGNDPSEYSPESIGGKHLVISTTNGTQAVEAAQRTLEGGVGHILVASYVNVTPLVEYIFRTQPQEIVIVAAGWKGQPSLEDMLFAAYLERQIARRYCPMMRSTSDMLIAAQAIYERYDGDILAATKESEHYRRLLEVGMAHNVPLCLTPDLYPVLAEVRGGIILPQI